MFEDVCNDFHDRYPKGVTLNDHVVAPTFHTVYNHAGRWEVQGNTLVRLHKRSQKTLFAPNVTRDRPVDVKNLADDRVTHLEYEDGTRAELVDNWHVAEDPHAKLEKPFVGKTVFKLCSKPTGKKLVGKQSTLPAPVEPPVPQPQPLPRLDEALQHGGRATAAELAQEQVRDTFREWLHQASGGTLEAYQKAVLEQLRQDDPLTNQAYDHDLWLELPLVWVRVHYLPRSTLFVPEDEDFARDLGYGRMTLLIDADGNPTWVEDTWRTEGSKELDRTFTGATLFEKPDYPLDVEPADPGHLLAQRPRGLPVATEPTDLERVEHSLTHLPSGAGAPCASKPSLGKTSRGLCR